MFVSFEEYIKEALRKAIYTLNEDERGYTVEVPLLPGCISWGENVEQAGEMIRDAIEGWLVVALQFGDPIPDIEGKTLSSLRQHKAA